MSDFGVLDAGWRCRIGERDVTEIHGRRPYDYVEVEVWREGWDGAELVDPRRMQPLVNVHGLWWRPAGPLRGERRV